MLELLASLDWSKVASVVGSLTSLVTMCIALVALGSWRRTLRNQRIDECVSAAFHLIGTIERYRALKFDHNRIIRSSQKGIEDALDRVLDGFRDFDRAYTIARRYRPDLSPKDVFGIVTSSLYNIARRLEDAAA
jgi:hypothetical protein